MMKTRMSLKRVRKRRKKKKSRRGKSHNTEEGEAKACSLQSRGELMSAPWCLLCIKKVRTLLSAEIHFIYMDFGK